jgi:predicted nucleotidyltransferase
LALKEGKISKSGSVMIIYTIKPVMSEDDRVLFAYVYGSLAERGTGNDEDIAVYAAEGEDISKLSADLKVALH